MIYPPPLPLFVHRTHPFVRYLFVCCLGLLCVPRLRLPLVPGPYHHHPPSCYIPLDLGLLIHSRLFLALALPLVCPACKTHLSSLSLASYSSTCKMALPYPLFSVPSASFVPCIMFRFVSLCTTPPHVPLPLTHCMSLSSFVFHFCCFVGDGAFYCESWRGFEKSVLSFVSYCTLKIQAQKKNTILKLLGLKKLG